METDRQKEIENAVSVAKKHTTATASRGVSFEGSQQNYNAWALIYNETLAILDRRAHILVADNVCSSFERGDYFDVKILDVGAGTGLVGLELKQREFVHVDALEPNECMLKVAKQRSVYQHYFIDYMKAEQSFFEADSYDVVTGCGIFAESAHVPCEALSEMIRIVKPGGYIVLAARLTVLERDGEASNLERVMEQLEGEKKWKRLIREQSEVYNAAIKQSGIVWKYQITKSNN